jgi:hypothetical protein
VARSHRAVEPLHAHTYFAPGRDEQFRALRLRTANVQAAGWVVIMVMTAALVLAILVPFQTAIVDAMQHALTSDTNGGWSAVRCAPPCRKNVACPLRARTAGTKR